MHGLDRINDNDIRLALHDRIADRFRIVDSQQIEIFRIDAESSGTQLDLPCGFLTGDIEHRVIFSEILTNLQQQRTFTDTRFAAEQDDGAFDKSAAEYTVQLRDARIIADILIQADLCELADLFGEIGGCTPADRICAACGDTDLRQRFFNGIPCAAVRAFAAPLEKFGAAGGAFIPCFRLCHMLSASAGR